jgi:hypothetical protein
VISFIQHSRDACSLYGLDYFLHKYGIPFTLSDNGKSRISVQYGTGTKLDYSIRIEENTIRDDIAGYLSVMGRKVPVFEIPVNTGEKGDVVGWFTAGGDQYPCITETGEGIHVGLDIFRETGHLLSGHLERIWRGPDDDLKKSVAALPIVDLLQDLLFRSILAGCRRTKIPLISMPFWPDDKPCAVCLTHDVDEVKKTHQWITYPLKLMRRLDGRGLYLQGLSLMDKISGKEPYWTFGAIREMEEEFGARSSFFLLHETAGVRILHPGSWRHHGRHYAWDEPPVEEIIRELEGSGWDIGLHGSFHSYLDPGLLDREKKALEGVLGDRVDTTRQHNLNLKVPDTWLHQERAGLACDTTLGFNDRTGFRWGTCFPFFPFHPGEGRSLRILEVPLIIEDIALFGLPDPKGEWVKALSAVKACGGVLTLLWHPPVFNEHEYPGWGGTYREILAACRRDGAWITSARGIAEWWKGRNTTRYHCTFKDTQLEVSTFPEEKQYPFTVHLPPGLQVETISHGTFISAGSERCTVLPGQDPERRPVVIMFSEVNHGD